jgi:iron complex outermembrane recepter protein
MKKGFWLVFIVLAAWDYAFTQINGIVKDAETGDLLAGVSIHIPEQDTVLITDGSGSFFFSLPRQIVDSIRLNVSYLGYRDTVFKVRSIEYSYPIHIELYPQSKTLSEVVIIEDHAKHEATLSSIHLSEKYFERNNSGTIAQSLRKIPGMQSLEMGPGIGKPVIRGLFGNRILINKDYIKQEGQQWGTDHGLELDPFDAQRIEIVKGPASLQYGSDGLGGVLNILPNLLPDKNSMEGSIRSLYKSNNNHKAATLYLGAYKGNWFMTSRASVQDFEDFRVPADEFSYNGFVLPLFNQRLKNTAGTEKSLSISAGHRNSSHIIRFNYNLYDLRAGIFSGAVGIPRSYVLSDDGNPGNVEVPYQEVNHQRFVLNQIYFLGKDHFTFNTGFQINDRREHSLPESHSQFDIAPGETLAVGLRLKTWTLESHYEKALPVSGRWIFGLNGQYQQNVRRGFEFLLPDFSLFRTGLFTFIEKPINHHWSFSGGARYDLGTNSTSSFYMARFDRQGVFFAETFVPSTSNLFHNWSGSVGAYFSEKDLPIVRMNVGKSYRIPYPNETSSNGIHHGNFRHELGNPDLVSENGYQLDLSLEDDRNGFSWQIAGFFNYFENYIYLRPSANFSSLPEAGLLFEYQQNDAIYTGFEVEYEYEFHDKITWRQALEYLHSFNMQTRLALPFTPPASLLSEIHTTTTWKNLSLEAIVTHHYFANTGIKRTDRFEQPTPGYHLFDILLQVRSMKKWRNTTLQFQIQNAFDVKYLNHMSRYRLLNVPEQGRNFILTLKIPFKTAL